MNVTLTFEDRPRATEEVLKLTTFSEFREFDVTKRLEKILVRLGPYDNSDVIIVERDRDTGEVRVLVPGGVPQSLEVECVYSALEEEV